MLSLYTTAQPHHPTLKSWLTKHQAKILYITCECWMLLQVGIVNSTVLSNLKITFAKSELQKTQAVALIP